MVFPFQKMVGMSTERCEKKPPTSPKKEAERRTKLHHTGEGSVAWQGVAFSFSRRVFQVLDEGKHRRRYSLCHRVVVALLLKGGAASKSPTFGRTYAGKYVKVLY